MALHPLSERRADPVEVLVGELPEAPLPQLPPGLDPDALIALFARDKKAVDGITFVLDGPHGVEPVSVTDRRLLSDCLADISG